MLESAPMAFIVGLSLAFLGISGLLICVGIFASRVHEQLNDWDDATWHR
jgi:hypothetical protein